MDDGTTEVPSEGGTRRATWVIAGAAAFLVVAIAVVLIFMASTRTNPNCTEWEQAKAQYVQAFPPIQQQTKAQLVDFNGVVQVGGKTVTRPQGC